MSLLASDGTRLTIQWSRSEIVKSEADDQGDENDANVRYLRECPEIESPDVGAAIDEVVVSEAGTGLPSGG